MSSVPLRVPVELREERAPVDIDFEAPDRFARCWRLSEQVSSDRLVFRGALPFAPGTKLRLRFALPLDPPVEIEADGDVLRAAGDPSEVALQGLADAAHDALARYLLEEGGP